MSKDKRSSVWFHEMAAPDVVDYAKNVCDVAILPLGAIEQHGPHCPCASDALNALDWGDRPLEIIDPRVHGIGAASLAPAAGAARPTRALDLRTSPRDGGPSLAELARKPTLSPDEALRALRMLR